VRHSLWLFHRRLLLFASARHPKADPAWPSSASAHGFLALFRKLLFSFFGLKQYVVWIAQVLFPALSYFSVTAPIVKLKLVQVFQKFLVKFSLQLKSKTWNSFAIFDLNNPVRWRV
jgi:hypothetical protein